MTSVRIEAESMALSNYLIESGVSAASNSSLISLNNANGKSGTASTSFTGETGAYDIFLSYFDERDGQATLEVQLGNNSLGILRLDQDLGSGGVNSKTRQRKQIANGQSLSNGELIKIIGTANRGEWARVDYIEFVPVSSTPSAGVLAFSTPTFSVNEDGTSVAAVTVTRTGGSAGAVSATIILNNGSATAPEDYDSNSITVNFAGGDSISQTVEIPIVDDTLVENKETINLALGSATGGAAIGAQSTAVLEIVDNDSPPSAGKSIRIEAESMVLRTYRRETGGNFASGGAYASLNGGTTTETGSASYTFTGTSGIYDVVLGYYDEQDGSANLKVHKGTTLLADLSLKQNRGRTVAGAQTLVPRKIGRLEVKNGETIKITGTENSGEPARVDYLEFIPVELNTINGTSGDDILLDTAGKTNLTGGSGTDTASYARATRGVVANLSTGAGFTPLYGAPNTPLKIMPLGDSITYGVVDSSVGDRESGGYRTYLYDALITDGLSVDFVGSVSSGPDSLADKNHEGHPGYRIPKIASGINAWLDAYKPDVIPLMIGTNDTSDVSASTIADRLSALIDRITAKLPDSQLLVSTIPPVNGALKGSTKAQRAADYNLAIPGIVKSKADQGKRVNFVDMRSELDLSDLAEGLHPNQGGYQDIANFWYNAIIDTSLDKDTLTGVENLVGSAFNDKLLGNGANNVLGGDAGRDTLTGGGSTDTFAYQKPDEGSDTITDFSVDDSFRISAAGFGGGLQAGTVLSTTESPTGVFVSSNNPTPIGTSANFLYDTDTGLLDFDSDGTGVLARAAIATLTGVPALSAGQFTIVA